MKIPEQFDIVIKKLYPEIKDLKIDEIKSYMIPIIDYGVADERFAVSIIMDIKQGFNIVPDKEDYTQKLNTTFKYTFPEIDFVYFSVVKINIPTPQTKEEIFKELFNIK